MIRTRSLNPVLIFFSIPIILLIVNYTLSFDKNYIEEENVKFFYLGILIALSMLLAVGIRSLISDYPHHRILLHAPVFITSYLIVMYGLPGFLGFFDPQLVKSLSDRDVLDFHYATVGWLLLLVGEMCIWIGYRIGIMGMKKNIPLEKPLPNFISVFYLWIFTVFVRFIKLSITGRELAVDRQRLDGFASLFEQTVAYIETSHFLVIIILTVQFLRGKLPVWTYLIVLGFEFIFAFTAGFSSQVWFIAVVIIVTLIYDKRQFLLRSGTLFFISMIGICLFLIIPVTENLRTMTYNSRSFTELLQATSVAYQSSWGTSFNDSVSVLQNKLLGRQVEVAHMPGIIFKKTPAEGGARDVNEFILTPLYIVPRFIWQDKPILTRGQWLSVTYLNMPMDTVSSSATMMVGEAYMFSGWTTLIIAMLSFGILLAFIYRITVGRGLYLVAIAILPAYLHIEGQFTTIFTGVVQRTLVTLLLYWGLMQITSLIESKRIRYPIAHKSSSNQRNQT